MRAQNASPGGRMELKLLEGVGGKINLESFPGQSREFNVETLIYVSS